MRIAIVAESFLPQTNGVVNSVLHVLEHLQRRGDEVVVIVPDAAGDVPSEVFGARVVTVPAWSLPMYSDVRVATGGAGRLVRLLGEFGPDVVHLASPFVLGWRATLAARELGIPIVAVYQTDVPSYAAGYGMPWAEKLFWRRVCDIHDRATVTLAPSTSAVAALEAHGVERIAVWRRGVDTDLFTPDRRDLALRQQLAPSGERLIGFVGRLAPEKQVADLAALDGLPGTRLVVIGDGPERSRLEGLLPGAHFTGMLHGADLARHMAALDVLVNPGETETFCQVVQEGLASGVPVVAVAKGGPVDLVDESRTGWLYAPGDLAGMRARVLDLVGDESKRRAFGVAARRSVMGRRWSALCGELVGHYSAAVAVDQPEEPFPLGLLRRRDRARR
ncbi:glycosyltransferase family 4 protein [Aeromicrobium marinum]|nr:glycosyltransferase family 1 protein [Aeromicrobium marinum]